MRVSLAMKNPIDDRVIDDLMADTALFHIFMIQMIVEMARQQPEPRAWAKGFLSRLYDRLDVSETMMERRGRDSPIHAIARRQLDRLAQYAERTLPEAAEAGEGTRRRA